MSDTAAGLAPGRPARSASSGLHGDYRGDIEGLRAVAVLAVVGFHAASTWCPGGFVGVDVFFVISGFLISSIIGDAARDGRFGFVDFYAKRVKRIFPALITVLVAVWVAGWFGLFPDEFRQLGRHLVGAATFLSNVMLRGESGYFDAVAGTKPLLHLWSLAIEEQFYIVWPLILATGIRFLDRRRMLLATVAIALASFAYGLLVARVEPTVAFYSPLSRAWELMVGAVLAQWRPGRRLHALPREIASVVGVAMIAGAIALFDAGTPYPSWRALFPALGAGLVIAAGPDAFLNRVVLSHRVARWFGAISYPLYLWHWPLLSFAAIAYGDSAPRALRLGLVALAIALAWATWRFVERPIRARRDARRPAAVFASVMAGVALLGVATIARDGFVDRFGERGVFAASFDESTPRMVYRTRHDIDARFREECNFYDFEAWRRGESSTVPRPAIDPACVRKPPDATQTVFLWGDSHAQHLAGGLRETLPADVALLQVASSGCLVALVDRADPDDWCAVSNRFALDRIRALRPDVVVIAQRGSHAITRFRAVATALKAAGVREVIVLGPVPQWNPDLDKTIARHYWPAPPARLHDYLDRATQADERGMRARIGDHEPFVYVDLFDVFCDRAGCLVSVDGDLREGLVTFDYGHLTPRASTWLARSTLAPVILRALGRADPVAAPAVR